MTSDHPTTSASDDRSRIPAAVLPALRRGGKFARSGVLRAFTALVEREARGGALSPATRRAVLGAFRTLVSTEADHGKLSRPTEAAIAAGLHRVPMTRKRRGRMNSPVVLEVLDQFHRLFYADKRTWPQNTWFGHRTWKSPNDLWLYQEIIHRQRPGLIIETGTAYGGSATYLAWLLDREDHGRIVSIDIAARATPPHPRVTYLAGSSTDPEIVAQVKAMVPPGEPVMVMLDSDHSEKHVYDELCAYADLVTPGSYLVVEDTNVNGHPAHPNYGPGPMEAARRFVAERDDFVVDESMHRLLLTLNPEGYLRRV
jgi:cephalosporin hydroxylase